MQQNLFSSAVRDAADDVREGRTGARSTRSYLALSQQSAKRVTRLLEELRRVRRPVALRALVCR
jgi:hypothetical protein